MIFTTISSISGKCFVNHYTNILKSIFSTAFTNSCVSVPPILRRTPTPSDAFLDSRSQASDSHLHTDSSHPTRPGCNTPTRRSGGRGRRPGPGRVTAVTVSRGKARTERSDPAVAAGSDCPGPARNRRSRPQLSASLYAPGPSDSRTPGVRFPGLPTPYGRRDFRHTYSTLEPTVTRTPTRLRGSGCSAYSGWTYRVEFRNADCAR